MTENQFIDRDFDNEIASDDDVEEEEHGKLLRAVHMLDSNQRIKPPSRSEPSSNVSEFDLSRVKGENVRLNDLAHSLGIEGKSFDANVANKIQDINKTLPKPLEKHQDEKVKRIVGYKILKSQVRRWDAIVQTNRSARTLKFPNDDEAVRVHNVSEITATWKSQAQTPLEIGLIGLQGASKVYQEDLKQEEQFRLTLAELREKRREIAKLRAHQSFEAAKARRQNKIKSKSYHRILRREKLKKQILEFETLRIRDPEAALKRLEELEKSRAKERMTLRHKNTGHWARNRLIKAKYDPQTRQELAEQLAVSRDLTKKLKDVSDSDEDDDDENKNDSQLSKTLLVDKDNPWITVKPSSEIKDFVSGYRKYWEERNRKAATNTNTGQETFEDKKLLIEDNTEPENENDQNMDELEDHNKSESFEIDHEAHSEKEELKMYQSLINLDENATQNEVKQNEVISLNRNIENDVTRNNKKNCVSMEMSEIISEMTNKTKENSAAKSDTNLVKKLQRKKNALKHGKNLKVKSTSNWIVTPIGDEKHNNSTCEENNTKKIEVPEVNSFFQTFISSVIPEVSNEEKKTKKNKFKKKSQIDKIFDKVDCNISKRIQEKLDRLKSSLNISNMINKHEKPINVKEVDDLGASLALKNQKRIQPREDLELIEGSEMESTTVNDIAELARKAAGVDVNITNDAVNRNGGITSDGGISSAQSSNCVKPSETNINPKDFIVAKPKVLLTAAPDLITAGEEALDEEMEEDQQQIISEAFADDNIVDDFRKEKEDEVKKSKLEDIDLSMPGWGGWGGEGIVPRKPKKRFLVKAPPPPPRRDDNNQTLIIKENPTGIRKLQVCELPRSFNSVHQFEASIRAPIGSTWIPETAHRRLIQPSVITRMGTVIKPMDEKYLVNEKTLLEFEG